MESMSGAVDYQFSRKNHHPPIVSRQKNMEWVFRASSSSWDLSELDSDDFDVLNDMEKNQNMEVLSIDPGFDVSMNTWSDHYQSTISLSSSSSPPGSSKRPRGQTSEQHVSCLVDGCTADLTGCRDYHRRHRVCETHSKTPVVTISGKEQRFCQQCSRFHSLGEFDEVKRSCRKRLDGHNRRRRKPRADSMYFNYPSFLTNHRGTKLLRFGGSPAYTTSFDHPLTWPNKDKFKHEQLHVRLQQSTPSSRERKFPFLLTTDNDKVNQPIPEASSYQVYNRNESFDLLGEVSGRLVEPKSAALSLLSKHMMHNASTSSNLVQPLGTAPQFDAPLYHHPDPYLPLRNVTPSNSNHLIGMIHFRNQGLLENEAPQVLSCSWE